MHDRPTDGGLPLTGRRWLEFALLWPGMRPEVFAAPRRPLPGARALLRRGLGWGALGLALLLAARALRPQHPVLAAALLLAGLSLLVHFGALNVLAGAWRRAGVDVQACFQAPLLARGVGEFWGRRWNRPFSDMTRRLIQRPLAARGAPTAGLLASFAFSALLHEAAISVPARAGWGLPSAYFLLQGALVAWERRHGRPLGRAATLLAVVLPTPALFHPWFVRDVLWPLVTPDTSSIAAAVARAIPAGGGPYNPAMLVATLVLTLVVVLALGLWAFAAAPERPANRAFAGFMWLAALWVANDLAFWGFAGPDADGLTWARAALLIAAGMQLFFFGFARLLALGAGAPRWPAALAGAPALALVPLVLWGQPLAEATLRQGELTLRTTPTTFVVGGYVLLLFAAGVLHLVWGLTHSEDPAHVRQLRLALRSPLITGSLTITGAIALPLAGITRLLPWVSLGLLVGAALHALAILHGGLLRPPPQPVDRLRSFPVTAKVALAVVGAWVLSAAALLGPLLADPTLDAGPAAGVDPQRVVLGLTLAAFPALALILVIQRQLTAPLRRLTAAAVAVTAGQTSARAGLAPGGDEVALLGRAFDEMVERLERELSAQRELNEALLGAERLAVAGSLAAGVAHEVNNPLAAVSSLVQLARERSADPRVREDLEEALEQVERVARVLRDLMDVARPPTRNLRPCTLNGVVEEALRLVRYDRRFRRVALDVEAAPDLPPVEADPDRLRQVLLNLLLNARDAVEGQDAPRIAVTTRALAGPGGTPWVEVAVTDSGPGVPLELEGRLFEAFFTTKAPGAGTGLGLAVCRDIAREHGGQLLFERADQRSERDPVARPGGARFCLRLPASPDAGTLATTGVSDANGAAPTQTGAAQHG